MDVVVGANQYGKAQVRMVAVDRSGDAQSFSDLNVSITLSGDLEAVHVNGDNAGVVTTDTQKNTVFAFAKQSPVGEIEDFALRLGRHFVSQFAAIRRARVQIESMAWERIEVDGRPHPHSFRRADSERRTAVAICAEGGEWVLSGIEDLLVLKTAGSEFAGYVKDRYTTLAETSERILSTAVNARWRHDGVTGDWAASFSAARAALLQSFAATHSRSLQQSLYEMARTVMAARPEIAEVRMSMPNRHHFVVDLEAYGLSNDNEIFRVEDRPYGLIEAAVLREGAPDAGCAWAPYPML